MYLNLRTNSYIIKQSISKVSSIIFFILFTIIPCICVVTTTLAIIVVIIVVIVHLLVHLLGHSCALINILLNCLVSALLYKLELTHQMLIHDLKGRFIVVLPTDTALDASPKQLDWLEVAVIRRRKEYLMPVLFGQPYNFDLLIRMDVILCLLPEL